MFARYGMQSPFVMLWLLLHLAVAERLHCPRVICSQAQSTACVVPSESRHSQFQCPAASECPLKFDSLTVAKCPAELDCPPQKLLEIQTQSCIPRANTTVEDAVCPPEVGLGEHCDSAYHCEEGSYCHNRTSLCTKWKRLGQRCSTTLQCRHGTVCSNGRCVEMWSVPTGEIAHSRLACESARLYNSKCLPQSATDGSLPKQCGSDADCTSTLGIPGKCACALNSQGLAYCRLHDSDEPVKDFLTAAREHKDDLALATALFVLHFPELAGSDDCGLSVLLDKQIFDEMLLRSDTCAGALLVLSLWALGL